MLHILPFSLFLSFFCSVFLSFLLYTRIPGLTVLTVRISTWNVFRTYVLRLFVCEEEGPSLAIDVSVEIYRLVVTVRLQLCQKAHNISATRLSLRSHTTLYSRVCCQHLLHFRVTNSSGFSVPAACSLDTVPLHASSAGLH
jgi:hypothetical protein